MTTTYYGREEALGFALAVAGYDANIPQNFDMIERAKKSERDLGWPQVSMGADGTPKERKTLEIFTLTGKDGKNYSFGLQPAGSSRKIKAIRSKEGKFICLEEEARETETYYLWGIDPEDIDGPACRY